VELVCRRQVEPHAKIPRFIDRIGDVTVKSDWSAVVRSVILNRNNVKTMKQQWLQFLFVVKATALQQQYLKLTITLIPVSGVS